MFTVLKILDGVGNVTGLVFATLHEESLVKKIRNGLVGIIGCGVLAFIVSCGSSISGGGSAAAGTAVVRSANLTGASENPPVVTGATGRGAVVVDPTTLEITGGITITGLTPSTGGHHIHQAPTGDPTANGPVIIGLLLASDSMTAVVPPNSTLTQAQFDALLAGELYFNVHTAANPGGEIRGQIDVSGGVIAAVTSLNGAQEVPPVITNTTGKGTLVVDEVTRDILIAYVTHDVANTDGAHIHTGLGPGTNGGIIVGLTTLDTNFDSAGTNLAIPPAGTQMTAADVADLLINYLYFNVHSTANGNPGGEIRGNIAVGQ